MITTEELFKLIENYLFAFSSKEEAIEVIFNNDIKSFTTKTPEEIEKEINRNLNKYFKKQFEDNKLIETVKKYIENSGKALSRKSMMFLDDILVNSEYDLTFEDIEKLLDIKELQVYLKASKNDKTSLVERIKEFQETQELEKELENIPEEAYYDTSDIENIYFADISRYKLLTAEEERYYLKKYLEEEDAEAFDILVGSNQGLCKKVARIYLNRGLSFLDLIQEGNIGLIKAIQRFDLSRPTKFSTYAMWWIRQAIKVAISDYSRTIRIPRNLGDVQEKIKKLEEAYESETGETLTIKQLSELTGIREERIKDAKRFELRMISFDKPVKEDEDESTIGDFMVSDIIETPEEIADKQAEHDTYELLFKILRESSNLTNPERSEQIMRLRMGIEVYNDETYRIIKKSGLPIKDKYTLEEVAQIYGITRERVRQLQEKCRKKMSSLAAQNDINTFENENYKTKIKKIKENDRKRQEARENKE